MDDLAKALVAVVLLAVIILAASVLGAAMGALGGLIVGWFFDDTIAAGQRALGFREILEPWELGAFLGFVGGFFRSTLSQKKDS